MLVSSVSAWTQGQTFTQTQLDQRDISIEPLDCQYTGARIDFNREYVGFTSSCLTLQKRQRGSSPYLVVRESKAVLVVSFEEIRNCLNQGQQVCLAYAVNLIKTNVKAWASDVRSNAAAFQTNSIPTNAINGLTIPGSELNDY